MSKSGGGQKICWPPPGLPASYATAALWGFFFAKCIAWHKGLIPGINLLNYMLTSYALVDFGLLGYLNVYSSGNQDLDP